MPPKKASAFEQLAKKAKGSGVRKAVPGSAFEMIRRKNEYRRTGRKRRYDDDNDDNIPGISPVKKPKTAKVTKYTGNLATTIRNYGGRTATLQRPLQFSNTRLTRPNPPPSPSPKPAAIESWRPAGGEQITKSNEPQKPSCTLGLARLSTWRVRTFVAEVEQMIQETGVSVPRLRTESLKHSGESVSDVFAVFEDVVEADLMRDQIQGALVAGRKLQVVFA